MLANAIYLFALHGSFDPSSPSCSSSSIKIVKLKGQSIVKLNTTSYKEAHSYIHIYIHMNNYLLIFIFILILI